MSPAYSVLTSLDDEDSDFDEDDIHFEVVASHVCSQWRGIALSTPSLWCRITITTLTSEDRVEAYVGRSGVCLLDVEINFCEVFQPATVPQRILDTVFSHLNRWKRCWIGIGCENPDYPVISRLRQLSAPALEYLSLSVTELEKHVVQHDVLIPQVLSYAPKLSFVRLRGLAMNFFRPPFGEAVTLHLDQTKLLSMTYLQIQQLLMASAHLTHLSVHGEIIDSLSWPFFQRSNAIHVPQLRSLRVCGITGHIYSGLLLCIDAPNLESLVLKGIQEHDLEPFCTSSDSMKYAHLRSLTFCDFDLSELTYQSIFTSFPSVVEFTLLNLTSYCPPKILKIISDSGKGQYHFSRQDANGNTLIPWPNLKTLRLLLNFEEEFMLKDAVEARLKTGHALSILRVMTTEDLSELSEFEWLKEHVKLEIQTFSFLWPDGRDFVDRDDYLYL
jgi:hypothetical protein